MLKTVQIDFNPKAARQMLTIAGFSVEGYSDEELFLMAMEEASKYGAKYIPTKEDEHFLELRHIEKCFRAHGVNVSRYKNLLELRGDYSSYVGINIKEEDLVETVTRAIAGNPSAIDIHDELKFARGLADVRGEEFYYRYLPDMIKKIEEKEQDFHSK